MATLKYVLGDNVDGADKYHLYKHDSNTRPNTVNINNRIAMQSKLLEFPHYGAIGVSGNEVEAENEIFYQYNEGGNDNEVLARPLRKITESGVRYYVGITAMATLSYTGGARTPVFLTGEYYLPNNESFTIHGGNGFEQAADGGWDLTMSLKHGDDSSFSIIRVRMRDADDTVKSVGFGKDQTTVTVLYNEYNDRHRHTEYIPIEALGDEWDVTGTTGMCVGMFDLSDDDYDYPKMAFYDKNLKFVGGAKSDWLAVYTASNSVNDLYYKTSDSKLYFTAKGVLEIGKQITGTSSGNEENYPKFVVFSSRLSGTADKDMVSVPFAYFPLFAMQDKFAAGQTHYVFATADSSSAYYEESPASNVESYYIPES